MHYLTSKQRNWIPNQADFGLVMASLWHVLHVFLKKLEPSVKVPSLLNLCKYICRPHIHRAALATILQGNGFMNLVNSRRGRPRPSQLHSPSSCNFMNFYQIPLCLQWYSPVVLTSSDCYLKVGGKISGERNLSLVLGVWYYMQISKWYKT